MYEKFFALKEKPFNLTPDPKFLYLSQAHREALASLVYGVREQRGFIVLTGEVGTGKTTLIRKLLASLGEETATAFIFNPRLSARDLLAYILEEFGIPSRGRTKAELVSDLNNFLVDRLGKGKETVLIIDEAQNLTLELLEEVRLLSNLETSREKLMQIILSGQPELDAKLRDPRLRQLNQRVGLRAKLQPLNLTETKKYVGQRLKVAGLWNNGLFSEPALKAVYRYSEGVPRLINLICDRSLLSAYASDRRIIDAGTVKASHRSVVGESGSRWPRFLRVWSSLHSFLVLLIGLVVTLIIGTSIWATEDWANWVLLVVQRIAGSG